MAEEALKTLKNKRRAIKGAVTRFGNFLNSSNEEINVNQIRNRRDKFVDTYSEFDNIQSQIEQLDESEYDANEREAFENSYFELEDRAHQLILKLEPKPQIAVEKSESSNQSSITNVKLPTINLPSFSGSYEDWFPFFDTFKSLIHVNESIADIQKFHYLKSSLKGEAANVLHSLEISANNYNIAWQMLQDRYSSKRIIIQKHIRAIRNLPDASKECHTLLRPIIDGALKHVRALTSLNRPTHEWDDLLTDILATKLDPVTAKEWEGTQSNDQMPTFDEMVKFLERKCQTLEAISRNCKNNISQKIKRVSTHIVTNKSISCGFCKQDHFVYKCNKLLQLSVRERIQEVKNKKLCFNCLKSNHAAIDCRSANCRICGKKHNSLLHKPQEVDAGTSCTSANEPGTVTNHSFNMPANTHVLLSTALVYILDCQGNKHSCRVLLDTGSQSNLISKALADKLKLTKKHTQISIAGISRSPVKVSHSVRARIKSKHTEFTADLECLVLDRISERIPLISVPIDHLKFPSNLKLADPEFHISREIDLLLGTQLFYKLLSVGQIDLGNNQPTLQKILLGWTVSGNVKAYPNPQQTIVSNFCTMETLNENITKFWGLEGVNNKPTYSPEEIQCEAHFKSTVERSNDGRYVVALPFRDNAPLLGDSLEGATKRFYSLENRLSKKPELKAEYSAFMREYLELDHMRRVNGSELKHVPHAHFYLPHHAVIKENSLTTKLRVVFDASAKSSTAVSLNDTLMVGPKLQQDLFDILARFRTHKYVLTGDITKMYRQIRVKESCMPYQRILWREEATDSLQTFELTTVTYGTASASYLAVRCLQQLAHEELNNHPMGAQVILRDFYVDDLLTGSNDYSQALQIRDEVIKILSKGKFELRKWASNTPELLRNISNNASDHLVLDLDSVDDLNTLGLQWNANADTLQYSIHISNTKTMTKRSVLSLISKIFDPLGLVSPFVVKAKILMQRIWQLNLHWDESLPLDLQDMWQTYIQEIKGINQLKIPRCVIDIEGPFTYEMHGFCDASERAYGSCVYIRVLNETKKVSCALLCAKSKVAPLKATTLPRLELCGALLLAQMMHKLKQTLCISFSDTLYWTDSTIVLSWLKATNKTWKTFVANRVSEIQDLSQVQNWHHISTRENPADLVSRGVSPTALANSELWWNGPQFLKREKSQWPMCPPPENLEKIPEVKRLINIVSNSKNESKLFTLYSDLNKLQRITAYCLRFKNNVIARVTRNHDNIRNGPLNSYELAKAMTGLLKLCQTECFSKERQELLANGRVRSTSNLICLNPFIDEEGVIRVGGRLQHSDISYSQKHQVLLPAKHSLTNLVVRNEHVKQLHAGVQLTTAHVRNKYWPLSIKNTVKSVVRKCITCFKARPTKGNYIMGNLPPNRVIRASPFENVGVDYFGPISVRDGNRRKSNVSKAYGAIFVCFATKAIHIELVGNLTSEGFLAALKRFTARRGKVSNIYSDNGTQFVGANRELGNLLKQFRSQIVQTEITEHLAQHGISWHFIPPRAPHFGGLWEAAVKSVKTHLSRVIKNAILNYEEMYTLLVQIEGVLNSRPITPISNDPNDVSFLTPSHFLTGNATMVIAEPGLDHLKLNTLSRWQHIQLLRDHFWKRWHKEYLHQLQTRHKWQFSSENSLKEGTLVIIREDNVPPSQWICGRVVRLFPGSDGVVRTVNVRTNHGLLQRPAAKLCVLPLNDEDY